jgi:hypothetical protein
MVVQLGFAIIAPPFFGTLFRAWGLTSGITSGIWGSFLQALLLSITFAPCPAKIGAYFWLISAPAENKA